MNTNNAWKTITHMLARISKAVFYLFSACMLYAAIAVAIHFVMKAFGASGEAIDAALVAYTCLAAIYVIGKTCHAISRRMKNRKHPKQNDDNTPN